MLTLAFLLRLLLQLVRADFRDPLADAIVRVTNWLILPLRRVLPPLGKIDTATVVAVLAVASVRTAATFALSGYGTDEDIALSRDAGFAFHLTKPVRIGDLDRALQQLTAAGTGR